MRDEMKGTSYSEYIESFLEFLREAQQKYNIAILKEEDANDATQDLLHAIELCDDECYNDAKILETMKQVRRERRSAKDTEQQLQPVIEWLKDSGKVVKEMEQLLGAVRKAERSIEGRYYKQKTDILEWLTRDNEVEE